MLNFKRLTSNFSKGFTLIELLIVMAILGVLATGTIMLLNPQQQIKKANDSRRKSDLRYITNLLNLYYNDNGKYPAPNPGTCDLDNGSGSGNCFVYSKAGSGWIPLLSTYSSALPVDPINNANDPRVTGNYSYAYGDVSQDGQHYDLIVQLENTTDPDRCGLKDYKYDYGIAVSPIHWCAGDSGNSFGGSNSNYIFQLSHE
jgi:prepilin-type N-terminal cleavage/methylation domain-containing protein